METESIQPPPAPGDTARESVLQDLRLRLHGSRTQERAVRVEARTLARELALTRRLLNFFQGAEAPLRTPRQSPVAVNTVPRVRAVRLDGRTLFHLDTCQNHGTCTALAGWAFRPVPEWDAQAALVTVLLRGAGGEAFTVSTGRILRGDVAAHFAAQPVEAGGARGIAGAGFACEVLHESLPAGADLEVVLRLEMAGTVCEQRTGQRLQLPA